MEEVILFIITFIIIFTCYEIFVVSKTKRQRAKNLAYIHPLEIRYLISKYNLDIKQVDYNQLLQLIALVSSLDMTIAVTLVTFAKSFILELVVGIISVILLIIVSYHLVYLLYRKKGMIKK